MMHEIEHNGQNIIDSFDRCNSSYFGRRDDWWIELTLFQTALQSFPFLGSPKLMKLYYCGVSLLTSASFGLSFLDWQQPILYSILLYSVKINHHSLNASLKISDKLLLYSSIAGIVAKPLAILPLDTIRDSSCIVMNSY